jgi:serine/threonine protein kinase
VTHLGTGGFASTFKIKIGDESFASKILDPDVVDVDRFDRELSALRRVSHPHVVKLRDFGETTYEGVAYRYIEMDFVEGVSLAQSIDGGQIFSVAEGAALLRELVSGASAIWDAGTSHRDLSPKNILITPAGSAVIVDLGMARHIDDDTVTVLPTPGTPGWMSPEQVSMASPTHGDWRSDQYVLGLLAFFILTGARPFTGKSAAEVWAAPAQREAPRLLGHHTGVPAVLANVIDKMTAQQPARRYVKPTALIQDLDRATAALSVQDEDGSDAVPSFFPVVKYYNGYATSSGFISSLASSVVIVGGQAKNATQPIFDETRAGGGRCAIDPDTHFARSPKSFRTDGFKKLKYGNGKRLQPFVDEKDRAEWVAGVWAEHKPKVPDIMISPYFYAGPSETAWIRETLRSSAAFSTAVSADPGLADTEVWTGLLVEQSWLQELPAREELLNELTGTSISTLYLLVSTTQDSFAPLSDIAALRGFVDLFAVMREADVPVVVAQRGPSGLLLLALGASAWSGGVSANLLNSSAHPISKTIARRGKPRIYVPQLLNYVPGPTYELMQRQDAASIALGTPEGIELLSQITDFSKLTKEQSVLLYQHNIRAMHEHAARLGSLPASQRTGQLQTWVATATALYRRLQIGNVPAFLGVWAQALTE